MNFNADLPTRSIEESVTQIIMGLTLCQQDLPGLSEAYKEVFVQMLRGIQARKDVKLSTICRSLKEQTSLIKTEARLSRNVADGAPRVTHDTVIALGLSDLDKPYAKKMEHLALVRDGSTGELRSSGYWLLGSLGRIKEVSGSRWGSYKVLHRPCYR
jgi:hypothetical protein